ncbi:MAG TPA: MFS transporter [Nitrososphaeraceae archaeon]|nr:MFS transporter [Nitrososphaeraceae archaeon]
MKRFPGLKNVFYMGLVSFFTDFSTEMIMSVLPLYIVKDLDLSRTILGAIEGSGEFINYIFRIPSGYISDKIGKRKILVIIGYGISTISKPFFILVTNFADTITVRIVDRIGKGIRTAPRDALIVDSVNESNTGKAFGIHRTLDQIGAIIGPLFAFLILELFGGNIQYIFLLSIIPGVISLFILIYFVKDKIITDKKGIVEITFFSNLKNLFIENKIFVYLVIILGIFSLGAFNYSFVLLQSSDLGVEQNFVPIIYSIINITHTAIGIPAGILSDRIGKEKVLIIGFLLFVMAALLMYFSEHNNNNNIIYIISIPLIYGLYVGISETVQRALISKYVSEHNRGTAFGFYGLIIGICLLIGNITFGFLWDNYDISIALLYSLTLATLAIVFQVGFFTNFFKFNFLQNKI